MENRQLNPNSTAQRLTTSPAPLPPALLAKLDRDYHSAPTNISLAEASRAIQSLSSINDRMPDARDVSRYLATLKAACRIKDAASEDEAGMTLTLMAQAFARFPAHICETALDPIDGLPGNKFPITQGDVVAALKTAQAAFQRRLGNAMWAEREARKAQKELEENARIEASRRSMTPEQRAERAQAIIAKSFKPVEAA